MVSNDFDNMVIKVFSACRMRPGLAMSQDGLNWARIEGEHHTGAILDVGEAGEWDELFIANPQASGPGTPAFQAALTISFPQPNLSLGPVDRATACLLLR